MENLNSKFDIVNIISASEAARNFSKIRKGSKNSPILILENKRPDVVIMSVDKYLEMHDTLSHLSNKLFKLTQQTK